MSESIIKSKRNRLEFGAPRESFTTANNWQGSGCSSSTHKATMKSLWGSDLWAGGIAQWYSTHLVCMRPWVPSQAPQNGKIIRKSLWKLGVVTLTCNPNTSEVEAGGSWVLGQLGLHSKSLFQNNKTGRARWLVPIIPATQRQDQEDHGSRPT
jgi:hypothetical protein